jgi:hypothetical protein
MENLFKTKPFGDDVCAVVYDCVNNINASSKSRILKRLVVWPLYLYLFMYVPLLIAEIGTERFFDISKQNIDNHPLVIKLLLVLLAILILISLILFRVLMFLLIDIPLSMLFCLNMILIMVPYLTITKMVSSN